jgi:autotransporter strand-loop-strand O-heptosyltransferase
MDTHSSITKVILTTHALGDTVAFMPVVEKFASDFTYPIYVGINKHLISLFNGIYGNLIIVDKDSLVGDENTLYVDYKFDKPIQQGFAEQLGLINFEYIRPKINKSGKERPIKNKYVTFSVHSTAQCKYWNHPDGRKKQLTSDNWNELSGMFRKMNITPVCVDKWDSFGVSPLFNHVPKKSLNVIDRSLIDAINYIEHSEFYIGLSSGMSWVAHALGKPVCMIANFLNEHNEFDIGIDDYLRITDKSACHDCWYTNNFNSGDWYWCPKHQNTDREFECHKIITPTRVMTELKNHPFFNKLIV